MPRENSASEARCKLLQASALLDRIRMRMNPALPCGCSNLISGAVFDQLSFCGSPRSWPNWGAGFIPQDRPPSQHVPELSEALATHERSCGLKSALLAELGARDLSRRTVRPSQHAPELSEALATHERSCGLKSALLAELGARDLSRRTVRPSQHAPELSEALAAHERSCGLKSALLAELGARDLSRRTVRPSQHAPELSEALAAHERSCGLKSALLAQLGRGIYPAGPSALAARAGVVRGSRYARTFLRTKVRAPGRLIMAAASDRSLISHHAPSPRSAGTCRDR